MAAKNQQFAIYLRYRMIYSHNVYSKIGFVNKIMGLGKLEMHLVNCMLQINRTRPIQVDIR